MVKKTKVLSVLGANAESSPVGMGVTVAEERSFIGETSESSRNHKPRGNSSTFRLVENQEAVGDGESERFLKLWIDFGGMTKRVIRLDDVIP